ncbi:MAG: MATE family efflux transporter [Solobacterium sp.]|nr:MATE family efflux transporter [Solobacterium sp.]
MIKMSEKKKVGKDLTSGPIFPLLMSFAIPMVLTSLIQQVYSMTDLMIIGKFVGSVGTVGVSTGGELSDLMTPVANGLAAAGQIYIAQLVGMRNSEKVKSVVSTLLTLMFSISIVFMIGAVLFHHQILTWLNCPAEALGSASSYLMITAIGMPFIFGYNAITAILRGMGESRRPLIFVSVAAVINIFTDLLLVVVIPLEAAGTAIATVASQIGAFAASFIYLYRRRDQLGFRLDLSYFRINMHDLKIIMRLGIPQFVRVLSVQGSMLWVKSSINAYGLTASATYSVGNKIEKFINLFIQGVDQAGGAMIGQNIGAKKHERVREIMRKMLAVSFSLACAGAVLFLTVPKQLYGVFTNDPAVIEYGVTFLRIMAIGCIVVGFSGPLKSISTGAGAAMLSLVLGIMDGVCRILICMIALAVLGKTADAYFWGAAFCQLIPGLIAGGYYLSGRWKTKKLLAES